MKIVFRPIPHLKFAIKKMLIKAKLMQEHDQVCSVDGIRIEFLRGPVTVTTGEPGNARLESPRFELGWDDTKLRYKWVIKTLKNQMIIVWSLKPEELEEEESESGTGASS